MDSCAGPGSWRGQINGELHTVNVALCGVRTMRSSERDPGPRALAVLETGLWFPVQELERPGRIEIGQVEVERRADRGMLESHLHHLQIAGGSCGAGSGIRTRTALRPPAPKAGVSAISPPRPGCITKCSGPLSPLPRLGRSDSIPRLTFV